jgi:hypothetical protein
VGGMAPYRDTAPPSSGRCRPSIRQAGPGASRRSPGRPLPALSGRSGIEGCFPPWRDPGAV